MVKFEIRRAAGIQPYYWRVVASNGRVLCSSETYLRSADAAAAVRLVKIGTVTYEIAPSVNRQWFFRIKATNGRILAHSETYRNRGDAQAAADHVRRWAPTGAVTTLAA